MSKKGDQRLPKTHLWCNFISLVLLILIPILLDAGQEERTGWKGAIEFQDGVKVIKNPGEPLYGEITLELEEDLSIGKEEDENYMFYRTWRMAEDKQGNIYVLDAGNTRIQVFDREGQYLRTIGRKGQGPGEFQSPQDVFVNDLNGEIYVPDFRSIVVFASNGDYRRTIPLEKYNRSYCISPGGVIIGETEKIEFGKNKATETRKYFTSLRLIHNKDGSETTIASYPDQLSKIIEGRVGKFSHGYEHMFYVAAINAQAFIFGFSSDYELNVIDDSGKLLFKIQKESPQVSIFKEEKDVVREKYHDSPIKNVNNIPFPNHKPHFGPIFADSDRIFVTQYKTPQDQSESWITDIFDAQGYYLYKATLPVLPQLIKDGFIYLIDTSDENGTTRIIRFRIKNWDQIKIEKRDEL